VGVLRQLAVSARRAWGRLAVSDRYRVVVLMCTVPLAAWVVFDARGNDTDFVVLETGLEAGQIDATVALLEAWHEPFILGNGGQAILVPADRCAELTVELSRIAELELRSDGAALVLDAGEDAPAVRIAGTSSLRARRPMR